MASALAGVTLMLLAMLFLASQPAMADDADKKKASEGVYKSMGPQKATSAYGESVVSRWWGGAGTAQNKQLDDSYMAYTLPFSFPFFGQNYTTIYISTNGLITFDAASSSYSNSDTTLISTKCIAPLWDDIDLRNGSGVTGSDIYILRNASNVLIRWKGKRYPYSSSSSPAINVECVLYSNGQIRFNYGVGNNPVDATVGISKGDGSNYILGYHNGRANCNQVASLLYVPRSTNVTVNGYVRTPGGAGINGAWLTYTNQTGSGSNASGYYARSLPRGWSGYVTPSKSGYIFVPNRRQYTNLSANASGNFTGYTSAQLLTMGGRVTVGGSALSGVTVQLTGNSGFANYTLTTNANGYWWAKVPPRWAGTVTPSRSGYTFTPTSRSAPGYTVNWTTCNFTAAVVQNKQIWGSIKTKAGAAMSGVTVTFTGASGKPSYTVTTNASGVYSRMVPYGWSGTLRASRSGYSFYPATRSISNITANLGNQNFMGYTTADTITIGGRVLYNSAGLSGVTVSLTGSGGSVNRTATTNASGYWTTTTPLGWAGSVVASRSGYTFSPTSQTLAARYYNHTCANFVGSVVTTRTEPLLVIMVDFTNFAHTGTEAEWANRIFGTSGLTLRTFYMQASRNTFYFRPANETSGTVNNGIVRVRLNRVHPNPEAYSSTTGDRLYQELIRDAILAANPYVNFAAYDTNGDGWLTNRELHLAFYIAGYEASYDSSTPSVWAHRWSLQSYYLGSTLPRPDGVYVGCYNATASRNGGYTMQGQRHGSRQAAFGTLAHELGHDLGLPDLYDVSGASEGVGTHCLMSSGSWGAASGEYPGVRPVHPSAWCKIELGFVTPITVARTANWSGNLQPTNSTSYAPLKITTSNAQQYFLAEFRKPVGFDAGLQYYFGGSSTTGGLAIWHIDTSRRTSNNQDNANWRRKLVDLEIPGYSSVSGDPLDLRHNRGRLTNYWRTGTSYYRINGSSTPNTTLYEGTATGISLTTTGDGTGNYIGVTKP